MAALWRFGDDRQTFLAGLHINFTSHRTDSGPALPSLAAAAAALGTV